jgi:sRNA-binding protein
MSKKRGKVIIHINEDKKKEAKVKDYSNAPKRTIKTTVIEAVTLNPIKKGTYIKLKVGKQQFETTPLFV